MVTHRTRSCSLGFTIVELSVVIAVIAILSVIAIYSYYTVQKNARDTTRSNHVAALDAALEDYHDQNGEYPTCAQMTGTAASVASLLNLDVADLTMPKNSSSNAIICGAVTSSTTTDSIGYNGTTCNASCLGFSLNYLSEASGQPSTAVNSRYTN